jgi:hypothetical protein
MIFIWVILERIGSEGLFDFVFAGVGRQPQYFIVVI